MYTIHYDNGDVEDKIDLATETFYFIREEHDAREVDDEEVSPTDSNLRPFVSRVTKQLNEDEMKPPEMKQSYLNLTE